VELPFLAGWAERTLSTLVLQKFLDAVGHSVTRGIIEEDAVWLSDRGLVITELLAGVLLVRLTPRGEVVPKGDGTAGLARTLDRSTDAPR
jgi:hypothetical protein